MKRLASVITLLIASNLATAADPQVRVDESLILAYNVGSMPTNVVSEAVVSAEQSHNAIHSTLNEVSASLGAELDARIAKLMTAQAE